MKLSIGSMTRRPRTLVIGAVALVVVLVTVWAAFLRPAGRGRPVVVGPGSTSTASTSPSPSVSPTPTEPPIAARGWSSMSSAPIGGRTSHTMVWNGSQLMVWSGWDNQHEVEGLFDGAMYDPESDEWKTIRRAQGPARYRPATAWTGREFLFFGGGAYEGTVGGGAAYRPDTDRWRLLPDGPQGESGTAHAWIGDRFLAWGGGSGYAEFKFSAAGGMFDPETNDWDPIAKAPIAGRHAPAFAWSGTELLVWGGSGEAVTEKDGSSHSRLFTDGAAYNPTSNTWRKLPESPLAGRYGEHSFWTGSEMLIVGGHTFATDGSGRDLPLREAGAFDPRTGRWRTFPWRAGDREAYSVVWTGRELLVWGGRAPASAEPGTQQHATDAGLAIDPADGSTRRLPEAPLAARYGHAAAWTGDRMVIWGGWDADHSGHHATGASYRPQSS